METDRLSKGRVDNREKVLGAALSLFMQKGFFATSMRDISRESALSIGAIYHYFKDKESVAAAIYDELGARMRLELEMIAQQYETAHDQCHAVVALLFQIATEEPEVMAFMLFARHREFLSNALPLCSSEPFEMMRAMVQRGMERGEIEQHDLLVASTCLFGGAMRMVTSYLDGVIESPLQNYLEEVWTCSWRAVAKI